MQNAQAMYAQNIDQLVTLLKGLGTKCPVLIEGDMGIGKSTLLKILKRDLPDHHAAYFDCTTKDVGDMFIPRISDAETGSYVGFVPNEEFGCTTASLSFSCLTSWARPTCREAGDHADPVGAHRGCNAFRRVYRLCDH